MLIFPFIISGISDKTNKETLYFGLLTGDSVKYWDHSCDCSEQQLKLGWCFTKDSIFKEYSYNNISRKGLDYGDIIWDDFTFTIKNDTLYINNYNDYKFLILKINNDSLMVRDLSKIRYSINDTILFKKSSDQVSPIRSSL